MKSSAQIAWRDEKIDRLVQTGFLLGATVLILSGLFLWSVLQPKGTLHCSSFGSYADALKAFKQGNTQLDSNHNGIPCENLYKHRNDD